MYVVSMLAIRLKPSLEGRLNRLAKKTGRTKTFYVREAITAYLEELEDTYLAEKRLKRRARTHSAKEAKRALGVPN